MSKNSRIAGAFYGVALADALGAPLEFMSAEEIARKYGTVRKMIGGGWLSVRPGEFTDDTQMSLAVAQGIVEQPDAPVEAVGRYFVAWYKTMPKDVGACCSRSIAGAMRLAKDDDSPSAEDWREASARTDLLSGGRSGGNGSLMRTVYPALYYRDANRAAQVAAEISDMTHHARVAMQACEDYVRLIHAMIEEEDAVKRRELLEANCAAHACSKPGFVPKPTGYVVDSHEAALWALMTTDDFEEAIVRAVNLGGDADTVGAIAGGIAGALYGMGAVPTRWLETMAASDCLLLDELIAAACKNRA